MNASTSKIHFAGLKLSLALVLALLVVPAYVVAPILFTELESVQAGLIAGKVFHLSNMAVLILGLAAAVFCYRIQVKKSTWYLLSAVLILVALNTFGVAHMMAMIKTEAGDISALADDDAMRLMFKFWHGLGSIMHLITTVLVAILVMQGQCPRPKQTDTKPNPQLDEAKA